MSKKIHLIVCPYLVNEFSSTINKLKYKDITISSFPKNCFRREEVDIDNLIDKDSINILIATSCYSGITTTVDNLTIKILDYCFSPLLPNSMIEHFVRGGAYLVTPTWLDRWESEVESMGFSIENDREVVTQFYSESTKEIVLIDCLKKGCNEKLKSFSKYIDKPFKIVGIDDQFLRLFIEDLIKEHYSIEDDLKKELTQANIEKADTLMAIEVLGNISQVESERGLYNTILNLFYTFFNPKHLAFKTVDGTIYYYPERLEIDDEIDREVELLGEERFCYSLSAKGFLLSVKSGSKRYGTIYVDHLSFPEYIDNYLNFALATIGVFGVVIENYERSVESLKYEKLKSLGSLAGGIAHDFNNILAIVFGNVSYAQMCIDDDEVNESLNDSLTAIKRATRLTKKLITFSEGGAPVKESIDINSLIRDTLSFLSIENSFDSITDFDESIPNILVDKGQVDQVVTNIIFNSIEGSNGRALVKISTKVSKLDGKPFVSIIVEDEGAGIPESIRGNIFDPYFTTKEQGDGLGLSICNSIVKKHNGSITFHSEEGKGSSFTISLPLEL